MMMMMRRRLACCTWDREITLDFDEQERVMTYNGLETIIINSRSYENESGTTDSLDEDASSCSSSNYASGSFSSNWHTTQKDEWEVSYSPQHLYVKEKPAYTTQFSDVEIMKERFAKLLLGEDITGGCKGISTALALSNAISNLAATIFGELWKLEPLPEERKSKWRREMEWLLSPTNYMIELVPAKQNGTNGRTLEIMTPKTRADIQMNLPALQKLDSMLTETLDSMVDTEFWYAEGPSRGEGRSRGMRQSKRWWLPSPQVPTSGLSDIEKKKLLSQGKIVHQVLKAVKSFNEAVLLEMPVPDIIKDALPKSGKANLGEELYRILSSETISTEEMLKSLNLKSENHALDAINRLEAAIFAWKEKMTEQEIGSSPVRTSWSFIKDPISELDKMEFLLKRSEALLQHVKTRYPNLPRTFLDVTKIQYGKDIGHSIMEAYSRVLGNLALSILSRIGDILQEDVLRSNPNSPVATCSFPGMDIIGNLDTPMLGDRVRHTLIDHLNRVDGQCCESNAYNAYDSELSYGEIKTNSMTQSRSCSRVWCIGRETCSSFSPKNSP